MQRFKLALKNAVAYMKKKSNLYIHIKAKLAYLIYFLIMDTFNQPSQSSFFVCKLNIFL